MLDLLEVLLHSCQLSEDRVFSRVYAVEFEYGCGLSQTFIYNPRETTVRTKK
jgi:hypothetical protein